MLCHTDAGNLYEKHETTWSGKFSAACKFNLFFKYAYERFKAPMNEETLWMHGGRALVEQRAAIQPSFQQGGDPSQCRTWHDIHPAWEPMHAVAATCTSTGRLGPAHLYHARATSPLGSSSLGKEIQTRFGRQFILGTHFYTVCTQLPFTLPPSSVWAWSQTSPLSLDHSWGCTTSVWEITLQKHHSGMLQCSLLTTYLQLKTMKKTPLIIIMIYNN